MHADCEYLCNVLSALSVPSPPGLTALLTLCAVPPEEFLPTVAAAGRSGEGALEGAVVDAVGRMRGITKAVAGPGLVGRADIAGGR